MQLQADHNSKGARHSREDIERGAEIIDEMWSRKLEKGDDEYDETFRHRMNMQHKAEEPNKPRRRRGRKI